MLKMIYTGMKRRRKETWYVSFVTFIAVLFMTGLTLFQNIMNSYVFTTNLYNYGDWVISSVNRSCSHPYLMAESKVVTGQALINEEGSLIKIYAGTADENFRETYDSIIYEGRMPQVDGEIAMDVSSLAMLGYSYELGQTIHVDYKNAEGDKKSAEFLLVGTLKNFSAIWKGEKIFSLPSFIVTEYDFEKLFVKAHTTYFYQLNPLYEEIDTREFANSFTPRAELEQINPLTYNTYVYENKVWGSTEVFELVTASIMAIGVLAIGYLMIAYTGKRRETYYRCRSIGASKMQIRAIVCFECIMITIPQILFGIAGAYAVAFGGCKIAQQNKMMVEYIFDGELFLSQIGSALMIVLFAMAATQFSVNDKRIAGNTGQVKPTKFKALRRLAKRTKAPEKTVFKRQHMLHPVQKVLTGVFTVLVCGCMILCLFKINNSIQNTVKILNRTKDFSMSFKDGEVYHYEAAIDEAVVSLEDYKPGDLSLGGDEQFLEAINTSPGIASIELYWKDGVHIFEWDNMEQSAVFQYQKSKQIYGTPLEYGMTMVFYEDVEAIKESFRTMDWEYYKIKYDLDIEKELTVDWDAVERGEEVIMLVSTSFVETIWNDGESSSIVYEFEENTLKPGMDLDIVHFKDNTRYTVSVGDVITWGPSSRYQLIGTRALAEKIVASEGKELKYSNFKIMYDTTSSYESTDKQLASLAVNNGMSYYSNAEMRRMSIRETIQDIGIYGALFGIILVVYVILQNSFISSRLKFMEEKFVCLKQIGMSNAQYIRSAAWSEIKNYLWIGAGFVCGYLFIFQERIVWNRAAGTVESCIIEAAWQELTWQKHIWFILFLILLYLLMVGTAVIRIKHMTERRK